ncbi:MAG: hypothetical protein QG583_197 [Patescibacteria group bacterium]|nr:hypothetical protein [Patescibacteria group bacterium]
MERPFICGGAKYTISATNTIGLPVLLNNLPSEIIIQGNKLFLKPSFHVSLVCINEIIKKHKVIMPLFRDEVLKTFCDFVSNNPIDFLNYKNEFRYIEENNLKTVIVMCEISNLSKLFEFINSRYNLNIEYPPTHVTLYAHDGKTGIFLTDTNDIENLTKSISNPLGFDL